MAYLHRDCGGQINLIKRQCKLCGKIWTDSKSVIVPPNDWVLMLRGEERKPTSYAKWADRVPYAGTIASLFPNWPRWLRIMAFILYIISIPIMIMVFIRSC
jgi:hypothetical protein